MASTEILTGSVRSSDLAAESVNAAEVTNGALDGDDVGRESGTIRNFDAPTVDGLNRASATARGATLHVERFDNRPANR